MLSPCSASTQGDRSACRQAGRHAMADAGSTLPRSKAGEVQLSELVEVACKGDPRYPKRRSQCIIPLTMHELEQVMELQAELATPSESRQKATYQDILQAPASHVAQIIDGRLYTLPRPFAPHVMAHASLLEIIKHSFGHDKRDPGGWWIANEPEIHFSEENVLVPDLAGWRFKTMPHWPQREFTAVPDWVCEVLSPSTRNIDKNRKSKIYANFGVRHMWLVDPKNRTLEAFELRGCGWTSLALVSGDAVVCLPPFDAISFSLGRLWPIDVDPASHH